MKMGMSWENVSRFKHTFTSMGKYHEGMQFETLPNEKILGIIIS
jgi:hypothetical protein